MNYICIKTTFRMRPVFIFFTFLMIFSTLNSCKNDVVTGCTNESAANYDPLATEDNGSCQYFGAAVFYINESTSQNLLNAGINSLKYYVNGGLQGTNISNIYWNPAPDCDSDSAVTIPMDGLGLNPSQSLGYQVRDQDDNILETGTLILRGNECTQIEFVY